MFTRWRTGLPELHRLEASAAKLDRLVFGEAGRVPQRFVDVRGLEVGIRCQDLIGRLPRREQPEQPCHRKAKIPDTWLSRTDIGADGDARVSCHSQLWAWIAALLSPGSPTARTRPAQEPHETGHGIGNSGTAGGSAAVYNLLW